MDGSTLRSWYEGCFANRSGWKGLSAEEAVEEFIRCYDGEAHKPLSVPCSGGRLEANRCGDPGLYDGIMVRFVPKGDSNAWGQVAIVETTPGGVLQARVWDGSGEDPSSLTVYDVNGGEVY